jgi:hypothetical protein
MIQQQEQRLLNMLSYVLQLKNSRNGMLQSYNTYVQRSRAKFHEIFSNLDKMMGLPPLLPTPYVGNCRCTPLGWQSL